MRPDFESKVRLCIAQEGQDHLLDFSISRLSTLVELDQREASASRRQRVLAVGRIRSVGLAKDQAPSRFMRVDLLHYKVPLLCSRHRAEIWRQLVDGRHVCVGPCSADAERQGQEHQC